jgi:predicted nucleic acid-binding protein
MSVPIFVDTNVLIYARDTSEPEKRPRAEAWMSQLWSSRQGRVSFQVLHEYYTTVTRKLHPGLTPDEAQADVRDLWAWRPLLLDAEVMEGAWAIERRFGLHFWDALIVASAGAAACSHVLSEDLQHGQDLDGVRVVSPFLVEPGSLD